MNHRNPRLDLLLKLGIHLLFPFSGQNPDTRIELRRHYPSISCLFPLMLTERTSEVDKLRPGYMRQMNSMAMSFFPLHRCLLQIGRDKNSNSSLHPYTPQPTSPYLSPIHSPKKDIGFLSSPSSKSVHTKSHNSVCISVSPSKNSPSHSLRRFKGDSQQTQASNPALIHLCQLELDTYHKTPGESKA